MSSFILFPNRDLSSAVTKQHFDRLYKRYGSALYELLLKLVNHDEQLVELLITEVFVEVYFQKRHNNQTDQPGFVQLLRALIIVMTRYGYDPSKVAKTILAVSAGKQEIK